MGRLASPRTPRLAYPELCKPKTFALDTRHGTASQHALFELAVKDLNLSAGIELARLRIAAGVPPRWLNVATFAPGSLDGLPPETLGVAYMDGKARQRVRLCFKPDLTGCHLYCTIVHELGHAFGLDHARDPAHVMFWQDVEDLPQRLGPTTEQRALWTGQIAHGLAKRICGLSVGMKRFSARWR